MLSQILHYAELLGLTEDFAVMRALRGLLQLFPPTSGKNKRRISPEQAMKLLIREEHVCCLSYLRNLSKCALHTAYMLWANLLEPPVANRLEHVEHNFMLIL